MRSKSDLEWLNSPESDGDSRYTHLLRDVNQLSSIPRGFYRKIFNRIRSERGETSIPTSGGSLTGMLLRSTIVRDYPGLEISAYKSNSTSTDPWKRENWVQTLRMEKLSSSIILCIFNDLPTHVRIQEPSEGLRMGVDGRPDASSNFDSTSFMLKLKNSDGTMSLGNNQQVREMSVRTRSNLVITPCWIFLDYSMACRLGLTQIPTPDLTIMIAHYSLHNFCNCHISKISYRL